MGLASSEAIRAQVAGIKLVHKKALDDAGFLAVCHIVILAGERDQRLAQLLLRSHDSRHGTRADSKYNGTLVHAGERMAHLKEDDAQAVRVHALVVVCTAPAASQGRT